MWLSFQIVTINIIVGKQQTIILDNTENIRQWQQENKSQSWIIKQLGVSADLFRSIYGKSSFDRKAVKILEQQEYELSPKLCKHCGNGIPFKNRNGEFCNIFCSSRCSRANRPKRSIESRLKTSEANKAYWNSLTDLQKEEHRLKRKEKRTTSGTRKHAGAAIAATACAKRFTRIQTGNFDELSASDKRERILLEQEHKCASCKIKPEWNNLPLKFELDHISGEKKNNSRENLRLLCPNCHTQTPTYKCKNQPSKRYSDEEIIEALKRNDSLYHTILDLGMNTHGGNYTRLRAVIRNYNLVLPNLGV